MKISKSTTLGELQDYIWEMNHTRGFDIENPDKKLIMLTEEVGELAKAIRMTVGMKFDSKTSKRDVEEELADVQIVLMGLASMLGVDIAEAIDKKEDKNRKRTWK